MAWISVRNWRKFQHYDPEKRVPPWIKNNTDLMANDSYLGLTEHRALMLHRLWLEYASARCELSDDTLRLSRRLGMKVTRLDLESLSHAGWIDIVASKALANGYHDASARAHVVEEETEVEVENPKEQNPSFLPTPTSNVEEEGINFEEWTEQPQRRKTEAEEVAEWELTGQPKPQYVPAGIPLPNLKQIAAKDDLPL